MNNIDGFNPPWSISFELELPDALHPDTEIISFQGQFECRVVVNVVLTVGNAWLTAYNTV